MNTRHSILRACREAWLFAAVVATSMASPALCGVANAADDSLVISPRGSSSRMDPADADRASWTRTGTALIVTVGGVVAALLVARRFVPGLAGAGAAGPIQVLCQTPLGTRGIVYVVRCGPRVLIVGATPNQLTTLAEIADPDEVEQFKRYDDRTSIVPPRRRSDPATASTTGELRGQLHGMLDRIETWNTQS